MSVGLRHIVDVTLMIRASWDSEDGHCYGSVAQYLLYLGREVHAKGWTTLDVPIPDS